MSGKVLTFYLNNMLFGIDIKYVKEINRNVEFTYIPGVKKSIAGLLNLRGQIITLFDLYKMLKLKDNKTEKTKNPCIILKNKEGEYNRIGFLIDKPCDVIKLNEEKVQNLPENIDGNFRQFIKNIIKLEDELILVINMEKISEGL